MRFKKFSMLTAGIVSLSLAFGTVGSFPPQSHAERYAASAASEESSERYEYALEDVLISRVDDFGDYAVISVIPNSGGFYNRHSVCELSFKMPIFSDGNADAAWKKTRAYLSLLREGITVSMTVASDQKYEAPNSSHDTEDKFPFEEYGSYLFSEIVSLHSDFISFYGDINADGVVDSFDTVLYRMEIAGTNDMTLSVEQFKNADINCDDIIDEEDLEAVTDFVLGKTREFNKVGTLRSVDICADISEPMAMGKRTDEKFAAAEMNLGVELLKKCFDPNSADKKNSLLSPLSISAALAMTANGADGDTLDEMEKVLGNGLTIDQLNDYMAYYFQTLPDSPSEKLYVADSVWFRDDPTFKVYDDFLNKNVKYYGSQLYKAPFDDSTVLDVNSWVNEHTKGMIPTLLKKGQLSSTDKRMMMMLINTLYFECDWADPYIQSYDGVFNAYNGSENAVKCMYSQEAHYYDLGDADAFDKPFAGGDYKFVGILPHDDIKKYVIGLDADKLIEGLSEYEDPEKIELHVMIPKFKYSFDASLKYVLPELGMNSAFDPLKADFSKINDLSVDGAQPLYIDDVLHKTRIEVCENGVKAAAVTAVELACGAAAPEEKRIIYIELDRPFVYMILDRNNVPVFIGAASDISEN